MTKISQVLDRLRGPLPERLTANDLMELAVDVGPAPTQVAALLVIEPGSTVDPASAIVALRSRVPTVPRLRQRLVHAPLGRVDPAHCPELRALTEALQSELDILTGQARLTGSEPNRSAGGPVVEASGRW